MFARVEKFESGWIGLSLALTKSQIDSLIARLCELKEEKIGHFHIRSDDFSPEIGIADIELSLNTNGSPANMTID